MLNYNFILNEAVRYVAEPKSEISSFFTYLFLFLISLLIKYGIPILLIVLIIKQVKKSNSKKEKELEMLREQNELLKQIANNKGE